MTEVQFYAGTQSGTASEPFLFCEDTRILTHSESVIAPSISPVSVAGAIW